MSETVAPLSKLEMARADAIPSLEVLQRHDPHVQEVLFSVPDVRFNQINTETIGWSTRVIQGSFLFLKRDEPPFHQFFLLNRRNSDNLLEELLDMRLFDVMPPYLVYQHKNQMLRVLTFAEEGICQDVMEIINVELRNLDVGSTSDVTDSTPLSLAAISDASSDNRLLKLILKQGSVGEDKKAVKETLSDSTSCSEFPSSGLFNNLNQCFGSFNFECANLFRTNFSGGATKKRSYERAPRGENDPA